MKLNGRCHCGHVRYQVEGELHASVLCHCPSCRRSSGAPVVAWAMFDQDALSVDRSKVGKFQSSEGVTRSFCPKCGTTLFFEADYIPGLVDITVESMETTEGLEATAHIWARHETASIRNAPNLVRFEELPPQPD